MNRHEGWQAKAEGSYKEVKGLLLRFFSYVPVHPGCWAAMGELLGCAICTPPPVKRTALTEAKAFPKLQKRLDIKV